MIVLTCVMCGCLCMWGCFDNCVGISVICVPVYSVFRIVCAVFLHC